MNKYEKRYICKRPSGKYMYFVEPLKGKEFKMVETESKYNAGSFPTEATAIEFCRMFDGTPYLFDPITGDLKEIRLPPPQPPNCLGDMVGYDAQKE